MADLGYDPIEGVDEAKLKDLEDSVRNGKLGETKDKLWEFLGPRADYGKVVALEDCVTKRDLDVFREILPKLRVPCGDTDEQLAKCVTDGDKGAFINRLWKLLGSNFDGYTQRSVLIRVKLYCRLIAVALGLTPDEVKKKAWSDSDYDHLELNMKKRWDEGHLLRYLLIEILEEDDEVMTVLFCDLTNFRKYPVPYFTGCTVGVIEQVQSLWLYKFRDSYFGMLIDLISDKLKQASEFMNAKLMLCEFLVARRLKAGARLLWQVATQREVHSRVNGKVAGGKMVGNRALSDPVGNLVKDIFNTRAVGGGDNLNFTDNFFHLWENYWHNLDLDNNIIDRVPDGHGQSICVGLISSPAHTDGNLLCWAARRDYHDLIWCVMQVYKPLHKSDPGFDDWIEFERTSAWKLALWCSTRHGDFSNVIRELSRPKWTREIDFNDYPSGWLPPLHLAAIFGDMDRMEMLCMHLQVKSCANRKDYLGRTPLDYAMQFKNTRRDSIVEAWKKAKSNKRHLCYKDVIKKLSSMDGVGERLKELYDMYIHQANTVLIGSALIASVTFAGWLQPPLGFREYFQFIRQTSESVSSDVYYESYIAIEGHRGVEVFVVFNTLSFFLAIATVLVGAEATLFVHDTVEKTSALIRMRKSIKWMIGFFISSMVCIMAAFICAGITILPPVRRLEWSMMISLSVGGAICIIPLCWIFWSLNQSEIIFFIKSRLETNEEPCFSKGKYDLSERPLISSVQIEKLRECQGKPNPQEKTNGVINTQGEDVDSRGKEKEDAKPEGGHNVIDSQQDRAKPKEVGVQGMNQEDAKPQHHDDKRQRESHHNSIHQQGEGCANLQEGPKCDNNIPNSENCDDFLKRNPEYSRGSPPEGSQQGNGGFAKRKRLGDTPPSHKERRHKYIEFTPAKALAIAQTLAISPQTPPQTDRGTGKEREHERANLLCISNVLYNAEPDVSTTDLSTCSMPQKEPRVEIKVRGVKEKTWKRLMRPSHGESSTSRP